MSPRTHGAISRIEDSDVHLEFATVQPGDTAMWEIRNSSGGWFHPLHVHLVDFWIVTRTGAPPPARGRGS